ncbi:MAG: alkylation response protein AidB-like acyl-CoA dehydrogenase, partial [Bacteroidia bacterium]
MQLLPSEDHRLVRDSFADFFRKELPSTRVRKAESTGGFDAVLWQSLVDLGAPLLRVPADKGGIEAGLLESVFMAAEYGRYLAPAPLLEVLVAARLLAAFNRDELLGQLGRGERRVGFMPLPISSGEVVVVPNLCACDAIIALCDGKVVLLAVDAAIALEANLGRAAIAQWKVPSDFELLGESADHIALFQGAAEEWKLLTASAAVGAAQRAMEIASAYANEREAFGRPIGSYQGIAHPLADSACDVDGAELLIWRAVSAIAEGSEEA